MSKGFQICKAQWLTTTFYASFNTNLQKFYSQHTFNLEHIWNCDEIEFQVGWQVNVTYFWVGVDHRRSIVGFKNPRLAHCQLYYEYSLQTMFIK
jgi:hypothetical protein